jgi:mRNA interferase RelE/StbE
MRYSIEFSHSAAKDFEKIRDKTLKKKIVLALEELAINPLAGKPLQGELKGCYSYRLGDYRTIYSLVSTRKTLSILKINHRREAYR